MTVTLAGDSKQIWLNSFNQKFNASVTEHYSGGTRINFSFTHWKKCVSDLWQNVHTGPLTQQKITATSMCPSLPLFLPENKSNPITVGYSRRGKMTDYFSTNSPGYTVISPTLATCVNSSCPDGFWSSWLVVIFRQRWRKHSSGGLALAGHHILFIVLKEMGGRAQDREDCKNPHLFNAAAGGAEHVDGVAGNQNHGGESHEPADHLTPQRIHVLPQGQRGHLNGTEGENSLWM